MQYVKVKDHADLVRHTGSNAILNTNTSMHTAILTRKRKNKNLLMQMNHMKNEIAELKQIVHSLINKDTKNE